MRTTILFLALSTILFVVGCSSAQAVQPANPPTVQPTTVMPPEMPPATSAPPAPTATTAPAATTRVSALRATLDSLLTEHVVLAASATANAIAGREAGFKAAADSLDANSVDISKAIGSVYGADAEKAFLPLWRKHIGFFVDYTSGVAAKDKAKQDKAVSDLTAYTQDFGAFLNSANPNLPKDAVAALVKDHVLTLKDVVDAQAAGDNEKQFTALRKAYSHMDMISSALAGAIGKQFPTKFSGKADSPAANLRATLTLGLQEHVYIAARATGAALGGRDPEFKAAAAALDANSVDLSKAVSSVYGADAEKAFLPLWRKHIGFVVDYTTALAAKDKTKQDKAVNDLIGYTQDFGAFLNTATPSLPKSAVASLVQDHILTLKDVIDAQAANDQPKVYNSLRKAFEHMNLIADPLAAAITKQFPTKFADPEASLPLDKTASVDIKLFSFAPDAITVASGTTIMWTNRDDIQHTITHGTPPALGGVFDSGFLGKEKAFTFTFTQPAEYAYFCQRHNSMTGLIRVTES